MSTRSWIAIKNEDGIDTIYCHFDGYLSNNGKILFDHYKDEEKIKRLIALGDISVLDKYISKKESPNGENVVIAYARDRGEDLNILNFTNEDELVKEYKNRCDIEYLYLWKDGQWFVKIYNKDFISLIDALKKENIA